MLKNFMYGDEAFSPTSGVLMLFVAIRHRDTNDHKPSDWDTPPAWLMLILQATPLPLLIAAVCHGWISTDRMLNAQRRFFASNTRNMCVNM